MSRWESGTEGLKLELEPILGNHDQEFIDNWYLNLNEFSLMLMEDVISYFDKLLRKQITTLPLQKKYFFWRSTSMEQEQCACIENAIKTSAEATKRQSKQSKFTKLNTLK